MGLKDIALLIYLHFLPYEGLVKKLCNYIERDGYRFYCEMSGRSALYKLALALREIHPGSVALAPDYICNVVYKALELAGFTLRFYSLDSFFEPRPEELKRLLSDQNGGILLTASLYGSSAFIDQFKEEEWQKIIQKNNIHIVLDLCQDINLIADLPTNLDSNLSVILSFNDKSFSGVMGGGVLTKVCLPLTTQRMRINQLISLYGMLYNKIKGSIRQRILKLFPSSIKKDKHLHAVELATKHFEYSYCKSFPYKIELLRMAKIQAIMAVIGFSKLDDINRKKLHGLMSMKGVLKTKYYQTSPYVVVMADDDSITKRKRKLPYAIHNAPSQTLRHGLIIVHNKGFDDFI